MTIETLRGRYRLHRFPPRQRAVTGEPLTASISAADYQRQLMDGFQEGLQKGFAQGMTEGQERALAKVISKVLPRGDARATPKAVSPGSRKGANSLLRRRSRWKPSPVK